MVSASKGNAPSKDRRKSDKIEPKSESSSNPSLVTLKVPPARLRKVLGIETAPIKEDTPMKDVDSPAASAVVPAEPSVNAENASDSNPGTPAASGTPAPPSSMGPPADGPKKKGTKRSAAVANGNGGDPLLKVRGKPGPKKKAKFDDGAPDSGRGGLGGHKLGPKANQGAINAGLRALDRSGKPCRKWAKGGFQLKSFTGTVWGIPRWTTQPRALPESTESDPAASAAVTNGHAQLPPTSTPVSAEGSSGKENKEHDQTVKSDNSNSGGDVEMQSSAPSLANGHSPAPALIAAAS